MGHLAASSDVTSENVTFDVKMIKFIPARFAVVLMHVHVGSPRIHKRSIFRWKLLQIGERIVKGVT